jgi:hypothetical protein
MKLTWNSATRATTPFSALDSNSSEAFLQSVCLPLQDWHELERDTHSITWGNNAINQFRFLELVDGNGGFPAINQTSLNTYRRVMRQNSLEKGHGIVEVQLSKIAGIVALKTITKYPLERRLGFGYDGWICVPLPKLTLNIYTKVLGQDRTQQRTTADGALLWTQRINTNLDPNTWTRDPYDSEFDEVALHHLTDEARFDHMFPDHPLTLVRQDLRTLERYTVFRCQKQSSFELFERKP